MIWCTIDKDYISFLKKYDSRIPNIDYGNNGYKPFFSPLFEKDGLVYVTQISSKKPRHLKMKESIDFVKIFNKTNKNLISVINLNYMFPVPKSEIIEVKYKNIDNFRNLLYSVSDIKKYPMGFFAKRFQNFFLNIIPIGLVTYYPFEIVIGHINISVEIILRYLLILAVLMFFVRIISTNGLKIYASNN